MCRYFKRQIPSILGLIIFILLKVFFLNRVSVLKGQLIDTAIGKTAMTLSEVVFLFTFSLLFYLLASYLLGITRYAVKMNIMKDLQDDFFASSLLRDRVSIRKLDISKAVSSYTAEINVVDNQFLRMGGNLFEYIVGIIITLTSIALIAPHMAIVSLLAYVLPIFFTKTQQNKLSKAQKKFQAENDRHTDSFLQKLKGIEAIKNYHIEDKIFNLFNSSLDTLVNEDIKRAETRAGTNGISSALTYVSQAIIAGYSVYLVFRGEISAGDFVSIFALSSAISSQIYWLARSVESVLSARPAVKSVLEYIDFSNNNSSSLPVNQTKDDSLALQINNLSFSYGEHQILNDLNLSVKKGEKVLILGASGTGKSSLMSLITGYLVPDAGEIYLDKTNRSELITLVEQDAFIFRGTLENNILLNNVAEREETKTSDPQNDEEITKLIDKLGLSNLWKEGQTVDQRGRNLSGGERKRLALARGFLKNTEILILDEPLANVDADNIERIEKLILGIKNRTVILISHQVSDYLYSGMDTVYELNSGKLRCLKPGEF
ncbi:MAG TPA: ABC transporter ATP-binding protein [Clostridiaceae bacterium]|nr:ABC transporter ATP-binding protein [Clostridiaceae bacterium]